MANRRTFDPRNEAEIVRRYTDPAIEASIRALAKEYGCCEETLRRVLVRHGVAIRVTGPAHVFTPDEEDDIVASYRNRISIRALADRYGVSHETLRRVLVRKTVHIRNHGDRTPRAPERPKAPADFTDLSPALPRQERARRQLASYFQAQEKHR